MFARSIGHRARKSGSRRRAAGLFVAFYPIALYFIAGIAVRILHDRYRIKDAPSGEEPGSEALVEPTRAA